MKIWPKPRIAQIGLVTVLAFIIYSLGAYFGVPALVRYVARHQAAASLHRPVTVGVVTFNPYKLRLIIDNLHVASRDKRQRFVDIGRLNLRISWSSVYRLALVLKEVKVNRPSIRITRVAPDKFDCSDLLQPSPESKKSNKKSSRFAISNIQLNDGEILLDDHVLNQHHRLEHIRLDIPFIANLPTDVDIYVQPLLQMTIDGSPFNLIGKTKPFRHTLESVVEIDLQKLDLARFTGYLPLRLPIKLTQAALSGAVQVNFIEASDRPRIQMEGKIALENVVVHDLANSPLVELKTLQIAMTDVEPLESIVHLASINIDSLKPHLVLNHDGTTNLTLLLGAKSKAVSSSSTSSPAIRAQSINPAAAAVKPAPSAGSGQAAAVPTAGPSPAQSPAAGMANQATVTTSPKTAPTGSTAGTAGNRFNLSVDSLQLSNSELEITDQAGQHPVFLKLQGINARVANFAIIGNKPASYDVAMDLAGGGHISTNGSFNLGSSQAISKLTLTQLDIPALQGLAQSALAGPITSGKLSAQATINTIFARGRFNVHVAPAELTVDGLNLHEPNGPANVLGCTHFGVKIQRADLASHQAAVEEVRADGLHLAILRDQHGNLNLASLIRRQPRDLGTAPAQVQSHQPNAPEWRYRIASFVLENATAQIEDQSHRENLAMEIAPFNAHLKDLTSDLTKPFSIEVDGTVNRKGTFELTGETTISPLKARLRVRTHRIELAALDPLITSEVNAKLTGAQLTMNGEAEAELDRGQTNAAYSGNLTLGNVHVLDKVTRDNFLQWRTLTLDRLNIRYRRPKPSVRIGAVRLSNFYARVILNSDARLNLRDVMANPRQVPVSLTRARNVAEPSSTTATPSTGKPSKRIPANIEIGALILRDGRVDYSDNFIKPNYSAELSGLNGKVGEFGTNSRQPAAVLLAGKINGNAPINISGSIDPLAPMASLDLKANANGIELTPMATYTTKYTGYPITNGTLTVDVHYLLANQQLTAQNHIVIDQLTFGDRVQNSTAKNLPIRLAVAILKDSQGRIDLKIPVSGSLSDPQFSISSVIWHTVLNLITKAVTSPFNLLASSIGGTKQNLSYIEFPPGYAELPQASRTKLQTLAKALQQRPSLKLEITGRADPKLDAPGLRQAMLETDIKRQKAKSEHLSTNDLEQVKLTTHEYNKYLRQVFKAADFEKPRDFFGMTKSLPPAEMKKMLIAHTSVTDKELRGLADARATAVSHALAGSVPSNRLLIAAPKLDTAGVTGQGPTTRADLSLQ